jgi:hypothetical protein
MTPPRAVRPSAVAFLKGGIAPRNTLDLAQRAERW